MSLKQINDTIMNTDCIVKVFFSDDNTISFTDTNHMMCNINFTYKVPKELWNGYIDRIHEQLLDPRITKIDFKKIINELQPGDEND